MPQGRHFLYGDFMKEIKNPSTYKEQINILKQRGCLISDEEACRKILSSIGYYRLSAYFLPFKQSNGNYKPGVAFDSIYRIYEFDRKLRNIVLEAIEIIEIHLRSTFSYYHSTKYGSLGYLNPASFNNKHDAMKFENNISRGVKNNEKVLFVKHHLDNYGGRFPFWVIIELFTFGMLSYFYSDLITSDKKEISKLLGINYQSLVSWLRCCTDLRNICAHYGRLYYRIFSASPSGLDMSEYEKRRFWGAIFVVKTLFPYKEKWNNEFMLNLEALFDEYESTINLNHLAFPKNWKDLLRK